MDQTVHHGKSLGGPVVGEGLEQHEPRCWPTSSPALAALHHRRGPVKRAAATPGGPLGTSYDLAHATVVVASELASSAAGTVPRTSGRWRGQKRRSPSGGDPESVPPDDPVD